MSCEDFFCPFIIYKKLWYIWLKKKIVPILIHVFWIVQMDSESLRKASPGMLLPAADEHGVCLQSISGEHNNGNFLIGWICLCL